MIKLSKRNINKKIIHIIIGLVALGTIALMAVFVKAFSLPKKQVNEDIREYTESIEKNTDWQGLEEYDKQSMINDNHSDLHSYFMTFPDDLSNIENGRYMSQLDANIISTTGYVVLEAEYNDANYEKEVSRIANITCTIEDSSSEGDETITQGVRYDEKAYNYPAYIAADGNCGTYEYALLDEVDNRIIYVVLKYISDEDKNLLKDYLKENVAEYDESGTETWKKFSIYAYQFPGSKYLMVYSEE